MSLWGQGGASSACGQLMALCLCWICASHVMEMMASAIMGSSPAVLSNQSFRLL